MPSNICSISSRVFAFARMACVVGCASRFSVPSSPSASSCGMFHSGCIAATGLFSIHVANPSFSQMLSHHCIVTRSPNHWCAISCAITSATSFFAPTDAVFWSISSAVSRYVIAPKFSIAPASKSGSPIRSSFFSGIVNAEVSRRSSAARTWQHPAHTASAPPCPEWRTRAQLRRPAPRGALEIAHQKRHQIGRHLRRRQRT